MITNKKLALFDNNIYVYHNLGFEPIRELFTKVLVAGCEIGISSIVAMGLMWYSEIMTNSLEKAKRQVYIDRAHKILPVDLDVAMKAAEIRREWEAGTGKKIKHGYVLIAATAIMNDAILGRGTSVPSEKRHYFTYSRLNPSSSK